MLALGSMLILHPLTRYSKHMSSSKCALTASSHITMHRSPHLHLLAFACGDGDNPETRADGEHGERGESSSELGIATFAVGEPAKFYLIFD